MNKIYLKIVIMVIIYIMLNQQLDIDSVKIAIENHLKNQTQPVKAKHIARNVNISPKQCRFMMRVYFDDKKINKKHTRYILNKSFYMM